jgi:hypothetical protein
MTQNRRCGVPLRVKALEPRLELKTQAIQAILDEVSASDPRAKTSARSS